MFVINDENKCEIIYDKKLLCNTKILSDEVKSIIKLLKKDIKLGNDICFEIKVIIHELIQNAFQHGNKFKSNKAIYIRILWDSIGKLYISIADEGHGFPGIHKLINDRTFKELNDIGELSERGRGLLIVKNLCENIKTNKKGNMITVVKSIV